MKSLSKKFFVKTMAAALSAISMASVSSVAECCKGNGSEKKSNNESTTNIKLPGFKSLVLRDRSTNTNQSSGSSSSSSSDSKGSSKDSSSASVSSSSSKSTGMGLSEMFESSRKAIRDKAVSSTSRGEGAGSTSDLVISIPPLYPVSKELTDARKSCEEAQNEVKRAQENLSKIEKDFEMIEASVKIAKEHRNKAESEKIDAEKKAMAAVMTEQEALTRRANARSQVEKARNYLKKTKEVVRIQSIKLKEVEKSLNPKTSVVLYSQRKLEQHTQALIADNKKELDEIKEMSEKLHQSEINKSKANEMARHMVILQGNNMINSIGRGYLEEGRPNLSFGVWDHNKIVRGLDIDMTMANRFFEPYLMMKKFVSPFNVFRISFDGKNAVCTFINGATHAAKKKTVVIPVEKIIEKLFISGYVSCINCGEEIGITNGEVISVSFASRDPDNKKILLNNGSSVSLSSIIKNIRSIEILTSTIDSRIRSIEDLEAFFVR